MRLGAQGYTIRAFCQTESDIARSLRRVRDIGYETIQISGFGAIAPEKLKALCDENGLQIVLTHNPADRILGDTDALIAEHQLYGAKYIGIGSMPECYRSPEGIARFAADFAPAAKKIAGAGLLFMYHNHAFEFERMPDGRLMMDALLEKMPADIMGVTADVYWLQFGGVDVRAWLRAHGERIRCAHLKDMAVRGFAQRFAAVGDGSMDFRAILETLGETGATAHALVEQDDCFGEDPFDCLERSYRYLTNLGLK